MNRIQPHPPGFLDHRFEFHVAVDATPEQIWDWLNDPGTFTDNEIWPFRVEFYSPDPGNIPNGFSEGVLTNHHGPMINFAGKLTAVEQDYRELQYFYGSYALSFRIARPYLLSFRTEILNETTWLTGVLGCYIRPFMGTTWQTSMEIFWGRFKQWAVQSIKGRLESQ